MGTDRKVHLKKHTLKIIREYICSRKYASKEKREVLRTIFYSYQDIQ
jgi:hypothetical protein